MDILEKTKKIVEVIKLSGNVDLQTQIEELEGEIFELNKHYIELKKKYEELENSLALKEKMKWEGSVYWKEGDENPYCPRCWEDRQKLSHLEKGSMYAWVCQICYERFG